MIFIILLSIALGMVICLILKTKTKYHGPNAVEESQKIHLQEDGKCIKFDIERIPCARK